MASLVFLTILSSYVVSVSCGTWIPNEQEAKTIKTKRGEYVCVDFYKQPTFNHPLLMNHTSEATKNLAKFHGPKLGGFGLGDNACHVGTVPISTTHLDTVDDNIHTDSERPPDHCVAMVHTNDLNLKLFGAGGSFTLYKLDVQPTQWSSGRIKLINGGLDYIEAGLLVLPRFFKDNETHLYGKFGSKNGGCYNLYCPGFVQVSRHFPLGLKARHYTTIGLTKQWFWNISIDKHQDDGHWWLSITDAKKPVGYWPKELFDSNELGRFANTVEWGGEIDNLGGASPPPQMGNGIKPKYYDYRLSAWVRHATIVDDKYVSKNPGENTRKTWNCEELYTVLDADNLGGSYGRVFYYGGPNHIQTP